MRTVRYARKHNAAVLFLDPTHQVHNVVSGYAWQVKGREHTRAINSNSGRKRITIIGALNAVTLAPTTLMTESNCDAEMMLCMMEEIRKGYPRKRRIYVFLDNAKYQHTAIVEEKARALGIKLIFLPPYSPNLNLIERLWKFLKKQVRRNHYYDTFEKFEQAIVDFFKDIKQHDKELRRLLTLNFEII
jgi:transposase